MLNISQLENSLWEAADQLRANSKLTAAEYSMPVLGLIFLRHATNRFETVKADIEVSLPSRSGKKRELRADDFKGKAAIFLPPEAHYDTILTADRKCKADAIKAAMDRIEELVPQLSGVLPKNNYSNFDNDLLDDLVRIFAREELRTATGDVFGRIYEYFLNKFAMSGAQEGGEFFTPPSLVRMIVNVIEPTRGVVFDPACGSAGMFVQTGYFLEKLGANASSRLTFYGQEKSENNVKLAQMNLAVHGLIGDSHIQLGNTFYDRRDDLVGKCDFVMSNPPFNVDGVSPEKVKTDPRLFTEKKIPGISSKTKAVSNANYLWIQYYYSYLNGKGRAGFVMASSASDAGHGEREIREEIIKTGAVDVMISIGTNFFYTRSLPCTLWFFDRGKPKERQDKVLMIDARNIHRVINRKIRDFSDEQLQNITAITWLYRGERDRYLELVRSYLEQTHNAAATIATTAVELDAPIAMLIQSLQAFLEEVTNRREETQQEPPDDQTESLVDEQLVTLESLLTEQEEALKMLTEERQAVITDLKAHLEWVKGQEDSLANNEDQKVCAEKFEPLGLRLKTLQKHINEVHKLTLRAVDLAAKKLSAAKAETWDSKEIRQQQASLDTAHSEAVSAIKTTLYFYQQMVWLQSRFPEAALVDVPGLCRVVTRGQIIEADGSLTPGRFVGIPAPGSEEDEEDFEERMREIHLELAELNDAAIELASDIAANFEEMSL